MRKICCGLGLLVVVLIALGAAWMEDPAERVIEGKAELGDDAACASCHRAIYDHYEKTAMARSSGLAQDGLLTGGFRHAASGVEYSVYLHDGEGWMSYAREAGEGKPDLRGERRLAYFVGSGKHGRTYLYQQDGLWFELPINFYGRTGKWDMAPNFGATQRMPDGLPVDPNCLHCHATGVSTSWPGARNRFADAPFAQGGVGCFSCHGDGSAHVASKGTAPIANPDRMTPGRRDGVCLPCHLEGNTVIFHAGRSLVDFRAGDDLAEYVT
jgi:hypothetical protein